MLRAIEMPLRHSKTKCVMPTFKNRPRVRASGNSISPIFWPPTYPTMAHRFCSLTKERNADDEEWCVLLPDASVKLRTIIRSLQTETIACTCFLKTSKLAYHTDEKAVFRRRCPVLRLARWLPTVACIVLCRNDTNCTRCD